MQNEIWKDAPGFPGYQVSNAGRVRSFERILVPDNVKGYYRVRLYRKGRVSRVYIHRLVASAFVPNPAGLPQINHKNEIKTDNRPDNLEWCTAQYNNTYGTARIRAAKAKSKAVGQYTPDGILIAKYERIKDARDLFGSHIFSVLAGKRKTAVRVRLEICSMKYTGFGPESCTKNANFCKKSQKLRKNVW